jgi:O-acetyl-ADP-ribose deacetylase
MMRVSIFAGDIAEVHADALCTSTNPRLSLVMGTGAAVRARGGSTVLRQCEEIVKTDGPLPPGSARVTTAGMLPHKVVIHCVASGAGHRSSEAIVEACVKNALACAEASGCRTIAMPVFAAGHARMNLRRAVEVMARTIVSAASPVEEIVIAVNDREDAMEARSIVRRVVGSAVPIEYATVEEEPTSWWWSGKF